MSNEVAPVHNDQHQARSDESSKEGDHADIPHMARIESDGPRSSLRENQSQQNAQCGQCAVAGDEEGSDVEEDRMHLR